MAAKQLRKRTRPRSKSRATPMTRIRRLAGRLRRHGAEVLSMEECCELVVYQLGEIAEWQQAVYDKIWGTGGGGTPPPPPTWPPA